MLQGLNPIRFSFLTGSLRGFIADYGVPLMVLVWSAISYIPSGSGSVPKEIPRRLFSPNPWSPGAYKNWTVIKAFSHDFCVFIQFLQLEIEVVMVLANITGHAKCASALYNWSIHSSNNDCGTVLF